MSWFAENWGTLLAGGTVLLVVALIVFFRVRAKKQGRGGCGCGGCAMSGICHPEKQDKNT